MNKINIAYLENAQISDNELFELLKSKHRALRKKPDDEYIQKHLHWVQDLDEASFWILPNSINQYYKSGKNKVLLDKAIKQAIRHNKQLLLSTTGDYGITLPYSENYLVYRCSGYSSKLNRNEKIMPFFLSDPIQTIFNDDFPKVLTPTYSQKPKIGFCGKAPSSVALHFKELLQVLSHNLKSTTGLSHLDPEDLISPSRLRSYVLKNISHNKSLDSDFIIRTKYRAGATNEMQRKASTLKYYQNILENQLIVCIRGRGNFSIRFYETLAMGRIPLFCDTDSPLPSINGDWNNHIIRFTLKDVPFLPEIIQKWIDGKNIEDVFESNRTLWKEQLSLKGFWTQELKRIIRDFQLH